MGAVVGLQFRLGEVGVQLDLVDGRNRVGPLGETVEELFGEVRHTDSADPAGLVQFRESLIGRDGAGEVGGHRLVEDE